MKCLLFVGFLLLFIQRRTRAIIIWFSSRSAFLSFICMSLWLSLIKLGMKEDDDDDRFNCSQVVFCSSKLCTENVKSGLDVGNCYNLVVYLEECTESERNFYRMTKAFSFDFRMIYYCIINFFSFLPMVESLHARLENKERIIGNCSM